MTDIKKTISLDVLSTTKPGKAGGKVKKSRAGKWRALVLLLINVIIAARLAWWLTSGQPETLSPVEPSESSRSRRTMSSTPGSSSSSS